MYVALTEPFGGPPHGRAAQRAPGREQGIRLRHQTSEQALVAGGIQQGAGPGCRGSAATVPLVRW